MNAKIMIAFVAAFAMLFAGVAVASEAADAEVDDITVKYHFGSNVYTDSAKANESYTVKSFEEAGFTLEPGTSFKGWSTSETGDSESEPDELIGANSKIVLNASVEYYAYTPADKYDVKFTDAEGVALEDDAYTTQTVIYNGTVTLPAVPAPATGFVAVGWTADGETILKAGETVSVTADMTFKAVYEKDLIMTFYVDGVITYTHAMTGFNYPTDPVKESFTFVGWAVDGEAMLKAHAGLDDLQALGLTADTTFTAVFEPAIYTVSFKVDGQIVATQTVKHGELATEPAFIPALEGMDFVEWDFDFTQAITGDTTIVAVFEPTPEPEPTGLDNPTVQIMAIIIGVLAVFVVAMLVWKKDEVKVIIVRKLDKTKNKEEPKQ